MRKIPETLKGILTKGDWLLIVVILAVSLYSYRLTKGIIGKGEIVRIEVANRSLAHYNLKDNREFRFKGTEGFLVCRISNHRVRVKSSSCAHKICVKMGWKSGAGEVIACIPNQALIYIEGDSENHGKVDAVSR